MLYNTFKPNKYFYYFHFLNKICISVLLLSLANSMAVLLNLFLIVVSAPFSIKYLIISNLSSLTAKCNKLLLSLSRILLISFEHKALNISISPSFIAIEHAIFKY